MPLRFPMPALALVSVVCAAAMGCGSLATLPPDDAGPAHDSALSAADSGVTFVDAASGRDGGTHPVDATTGSDTGVVTFRCGSQSSGPLCDTATEFCLLMYSGGPVMLPQCRPFLPDCDGSPSCACAMVPDTPDTVVCTDTDGAVTVSEGCLPCQ